MKKLFILIFSIFYFAGGLVSQITQSIEFDNINGDGDLVNCFFQDEFGIIWIGAGGGMYTYNGASMQKKGLLAPPQLISQMVHCTLNINPAQYYTGTSNGLGMLNIETDTYSLCSETEGLDIRSLARLNDHELLLGTMSGLFRYNLSTNTREIVQALALYPVYSIITWDDQGFFISSYEGFYYYQPGDNSFTFIPLPGAEDDPSLVISMIRDTNRKDIWVGTERELLKYHVEEQEFRNRSYLAGNSIKSMQMTTGGKLWVGTDNGLYIYSSGSDEYEYLVHTSRDSHSLINNSIWGIFEDREGNIWLGTDRGISLYRHTTSYSIYHWENIVRSNEGNRIECILRDSRNNIWLGGSNGVAHFNPSTRRSAWYKMKESAHYISHNRIRTIYEDNEGELWVTSDGSISRFDYNSLRFVNYVIMDSTETRNANWAYNIFDDEKGNLWISSYLGGIFVVNKKKLKAHPEARYLAERNYFMNPGRNGLISNRVLLSAMDQKGDVWVYGKGLDGLNKIEVENNRVIHFSQGLPDSQLPEFKIASILAGEDGYIWVGTWGAMVRIDPSNNEIVTFEDDHLPQKGIYSMAEEDDRIWLIVSDGICAFNKNDHTFQYMLLERAPYSIVYRDDYDQQMWIGGEDHFLAFSPEHYLNYENESTLLLTDLYINEERINPGEKLEGSVILEKDILFTKNVTLRHNQNHISFQFTDVRYSRSIKPHYMYKMEGEDKIWRNMDSYSGRISYSNLIPGKYKLFIKQVRNEDDHSMPELVMSLHVLAPWYAKRIARLLYVLLLSSLLIWIVNYFRVRNRLKIERIEREKTLELSNMKMEFLTNISHELKTPLSLILNPVNKIIAETKNISLKEQLKLVQKNAGRLNTLVHQIIHYNDKDHTLSGLKLSRLELVEFIHSILHMHLEAFATKKIRLEFSPYQAQVYVKADIFKLETILNNLISNAFKFSHAESVIYVILDLVDEDKKLLRLQVRDEGVGIPQKDLLLIFERFYQSDHHTAINSEGSGIGLSLVRNFTELHKGRVEIASKKNEGTTVTLYLPILEETLAIPAETILPKEKVNRDMKVLIVEDNVEIAQFIAENLQGADYRIAHNGKKGMEIAMEYMPDVIISDIMMPVMNGLEMSRLLRQNVNTATIPVIILTAKDDQYTEKEAFSMGVEAFIPKPFDIDILNMRIQRIFDNNKHLVNKLRQQSLIQEKEIIAESQDEIFLSRITDIIEEKLDDPELSVQKLATLSGYSGKQIYRRIKLLTGNTAVDYIKSIRLKKAALLLLQKKFTVAEVMYMVGFSNHSYFSKCFSARYGKTPKQYMEKGV